MKVQTEKGLLERDALTVRDIVEYSDGARILATEWYLHDERVRRDVWVNVLRGLEMGV